MLWKSKRQKNLEKENEYLLARLQFESMWNGFFQETLGKLSDITIQGDIDGVDASHYISGILEAYDIDQRQTSKYLEGGL